MNRYPDPDATLLRRRIAERYETEPGAGRRRQRVLRDPARRGRGALRARRRDRLRLAGLLDVPVPAGADRSPGGPRAARRGRHPRPRRDGRRGDRGDPAASSSATRTTRPAPHLPGRRDRRLLRAAARPRDDRPRRGLRRVPDPRRPRRDASTCSPTSRTWSSCARSASATASRACGSATRIGSAEVPRRGRRRPPAVQRQRPRPGRRAPRRSSTRTTSPAGSRARSPSGSASRRAARSSALRTAATQANFSWIDLGDADESGGDRRPRRARDRRPSRHALGDPGHIRVTYGTAAENEPLPVALATCSQAELPTWHCSRKHGAACYKQCSEANRPHRDRHPRPRRRARRCPLLLLLAI